jgi:hypothetical protein
MQIRKENFMTNLVTLQLTVPALEKLFEGDPTIALTMRQAAITEFARRKMGDIIPKALKAEIDAAIAKEIGTINYSGYTPKITLQETILQEIRSEGRKTMDAHQKTITTLIQEAAQTAIDEQIALIQSRITREIERRITSEITNRISDGIKTKMNEMMKIAQT